MEKCRQYRGQMSAQPAARRRISSMFLVTLGKWQVRAQMCAKRIAQKSLGFVRHLRDFLTREAEDNSLKIL